MCGISGYLGDDEAAGRRYVARANEILAHRGPDDEGVWSRGSVALGHRRLSIVDLSAAGHQPMTSPDGRWTIVYNGEVYNHASLRPELEREWAFKGHSDTETVLAALALRGPAALERMVGMWALLAWDDAEQHLLVSRDRYGQKPLYWRLDAGGGLRLASEIRPLFDEGERPALYATAAAEYLATGNYGHLGERTFFRDVRSFPPGHWAYVRPGDRRVEPRRYWRFPVVDPADRRPYDEVARRQFRDAFEEAVSSQLMSDVPVGATLSGGLDSSAVVGMMASGARAPIPVFTAQAAGSAYDETRYVRAVEAKWKGALDVRWSPLERMSISETLPSTLRVQEEPFGDPSIAAHGFLMDAARAAKVPVILGGQGGDELLFGYPYMGHALLADSLRRGRVGWAIGEARALGLGRATLARIGLSAVAPPFERRARERSRMGRRTWLSPELTRAAGALDFELAAASDARSVLLETVERFSLPHLTHYDDRSGMARSIEGRMPFLDHRLAAVVGSLAPESFVGGGGLKRVLRDACADLLPSEVLGRRDKIGFFTPLRDMLRAESAWVAERVGDERSRELGLFDVEAVVARARAIADGNAGGDAAHVVFRALSMRLWAEEFDVAPLA